VADAWTIRKSAKDLGSIAIDGSSLLARFRDTSASTTANEIDVGAVMDSLVVTAPGRIRKQLRVTLANEGNAWGRSLVGSHVTYTHSLSGTAETGTGWLAECNENAGGVDGGSTEDYVLNVVAYT
jgi:hypothetical protein